MWVGVGGGCSIQLNVFSKMWPISIDFGSIVNRKTKVTGIHAR